MTRAEREIIALKKREEEVAKLREAQKGLLEKRKAFIQDAKRTGFNFFFSFACTLHFVFSFFAQSNIFLIFLQVFK